MYGNMKGVYERRKSEVRERPKKIQKEELDGDSAFRSGCCGMAFDRGDSLPPPKAVQGTIAGTIVR
jgi:hypothetical protein